MQRNISKSQKWSFRGDTHIRVAVAQDLVQDVAELPAEDGTAGQGQPDGVGPEGERTLLVVCPQDDPCPAVKANRTQTGAGDRLGWGLSWSTCIKKGTCTECTAGMEISGAMLHPQIKPHLSSPGAPCPAAGHTGALCILLPKKCQLIALPVCILLMDKPTLCHPPTKL